MEKFLSDRWNDIVALNSAQWFVILSLAVTIGTGLFFLFSWLYSQRPVDSKVNDTGESPEWWSR